uniref:Cytochrome c oxidase assembly factor 3 mitochondrial coiled-coil domain-containing protein n=1 Tax=Romanomermis culicivorax TaxID=13658 RepID=A0A915KU51_ROMCU
ILTTGLFVLVGSIYAYTIKRFGQEDFLDDNEPLQKPVIL